ncbi:hypothetical protein HMPREF0262_00242 [Clostridium sp. ATCC 29733]|nr:hypothetical protein HMPREF0262_00242 [Clostridium sp. ATCC 29733]
MGEGPPLFAKKRDGFGRPKGKCSVHFAKYARKYVYKQAKIIQGE